jgi:hypothetical protein
VILRGTKTGGLKRTCVSTPKGNAERGRGRDELTACGDAVTDRLLEGYAGAHESSLKSQETQDGTSNVVRFGSHWRRVVRRGNIAASSKEGRDHTDMVLLKRGHSVVDATRDPKNTFDRSFLDSPWSRIRHLRPHYWALGALRVNGPDRTLPIP